MKGPPTVGVVGDPALTADLFVHWLVEAEIPRSGFRSPQIREQLQDNAYRGEHRQVDRRDGRPDEIAAAPQRSGPGKPALHDRRRALHHRDMEDLNVPDLRSFIFTIHFGSIGLGMAYAIGAAYAAPDRPGLLVTGDGGFMLGGLTEFNTAVRHEVDLMVAGGRPEKMTRLH